MDTTILNDALGTDVLLNDNTVQQPKPSKPPPIYIEARFNWHSQVQNLKNIAASIQCTTTKSAKFLRLSIDTDGEYCALVKHLIMTKVPYKSHNLTEDKSLKIVIGRSPL